ncbi:MAG TPA: PH domain-containing protein [Stellaceae bacterium]|nr:PH domain-containing protein [Stellaceae bacterium]
MRYVTRVLQPGETVVYETQLHWLIYLRAILALIAAALLAIGALSIASDQRQYLSLSLWIAAAIFALLACSAGLGAFVRRATTELAVTDHRVIYKTGLLSRHTLEMNLSKVESVDVDQTVLGRIFSYGTVIVRGTGGSLEPMRRIADPLAFRSRITAADQSRA